MWHTRKILILVRLTLALCAVTSGAVWAKQAETKPATLNFGSLMTPADQQHLFSDNFALVYTVRQIPQSVQQRLLGKGERQGMADAGKPFERTDMVGPIPLPFRRLVFAAVSADDCLVYNQYGGFGEGTEVSYYHLAAGQAALVWRATLMDLSGSLSWPQLRGQISKGKFWNQALQDYGGKPEAENTAADALQLVGYPQSAAFDAVVKEHLYPSDKPTPELLEGTWFLNGNPSVAMECGVDTEGKGYTFRAVYDWAYQNSGTIQLDDRNLQALRAVLQALPPSSSHPPMDKLLILSYKSGDKWVTRLYDKEHLPASVQQAYEVLGASVTDNSGRARYGN